MSVMARTSLVASSTQNGTLFRFPLYPPPVATADTSLAFQSLTVEIIGVILTGVGLVFLAVQLGRNYSLQRQQVGMGRFEDQLLEMTEVCSEARTVEQGD